MGKSAKKKSGQDEGKDCKESENPGRTAKPPNVTTPPTQSQQCKQSEQGWTAVVDKQKAKRKRRSTGEHMTVDDKLDHIMSKMSLLNSIERKVGRLDKKLTRNMADVSEIRSDINEFDMRLKSLEYRSIDQEARGRRNNLLFWGIPESDSRNEDCEQVVRGFLRDNLKVDPSSIAIQRIHRNGQAKRGKVRPIIANFLDYKDTEKIMENARNLKGSGKGVSRDLPEEILVARRKLLPKLRDLKQRGQGASIRYPAKLVVDGVTVEDEFPNWYHFIHKRYNTPTTTSTDQEPNIRSPQRVPVPHHDEPEGPSEEDEDSEDPGSDSSTDDSDTAVEMEDEC